MGRHWWTRRRLLSVRCGSASSYFALAGDSSPVRRSPRGSSCPGGLARFGVIDLRTERPVEAGDTRECEEVAKRANFVSASRRGRALGSWPWEVEAIACPTSKRSLDRCLE